MDVVTRNGKFHLANPTYKLEHPLAADKIAPSEEGELKDGMDFSLPTDSKLTLYFDDPIGIGNMPALENSYYGWGSNLAPQSNQFNREFKENKELNIQEVGNQFVNGQNKTVFVIQPKGAVPQGTKIDFGITLDGQWGRSVALGSKLTISTETA